LALAILVDIGSPTPAVTRIAFCCAMSNSFYLSMV